ncbi:hypothetical protein LZ155_02890, partial [Streptococcus agalactiae]|nr:hypothetical protein [Streptococcus agalactiae]
IIYQLTIYLVVNFSYYQTCYFMYVGRTGSNPVVSVVVISATRAIQRAWDIERSYNRFCVDLMVLITFDS